MLRYIKIRTRYFIPKPNLKSNPNSISNVNPYPNLKSNPNPNDN